MSEQDYAAIIQVTASADEVFDALTTLEGLSAWWTPATGDAKAGGEVTFSFGAEAQAVMRVDAAEPGVGVRWTNTACVVEDWVGTEQVFDLEPIPGGGTAIHFRHVGLTPQLECYGQCESGWNHFVASLAAYVETGTGYPNGSPQDAARREEYASRVAVGVT